MFSNKLDNLVDSCNEEHLISCYQNRNALSPLLSAIGKNRVVGHFEMEEGVTKKNRVAGCSKIEKRIMSANGDTLNVIFLY